jgi:hypothetical protein
VTYNTTDVHKQTSTHNRRAIQHTTDVQHNIQQTRHRRGGTAGVYVEIDWPPPFALLDVEQVARPSSGSHQLASSGSHQL